MSVLLELLSDYLTLRDVLLCSSVSLASWLFYKAGVVVSFTDSQSTWLCAYSHSSHHHDCWSRGY